MKKKFLVTAMMIATVLFLTGCAAGPVERLPLTPNNASGFWESFFVLPLTQFITWLHSILGGSLGLAIILATVLSRLVVMPLTLRSMSMSAKMQELAPEQEKIKKKYANKPDRESQMKMQQEIGALFRESGVNPMAGCLPMLIQMPIMIAFFQSMQRHPLIATVDESVLFFGLNLAEIGGIANYIFAALVAGLMFYSQKKMQQKQKAQGIGNNPMAGSMGMMNIGFAVMMFMVVISTNLAMGLFFLVGQIMANVQSIIMKKPTGPTI